MFRSSSILRELTQSLDKVTLLLKYSVNLRCCILSGEAAACREMACVLFVVQNDTDNFTECFNRSVALARLGTSSLKMVEDRNM